MNPNAVNALAVYFSNVLSHILTSGTRSTLATTGSTAMSATAIPAAGTVTATVKTTVVTPIGRTTTGDNGGGRQPAGVKAARALAAASKAAPAKIVTATAMGPSGYREEFGVLTDAQIVDAVRASFDPSEFTLTDEQIVGAIGWALTVRTAVTRVTALLTA
jgi:hypothetical protein